MTSAHLDNETAQRAAELAREGEGYPWLRAYPPKVDWFQTFTPCPVPEFLHRAVATFPNKPATHFLGREMSYLELALEVDKAARGLKSLGVGKGVHVGLLLPNCPAFVIYYYAILKVGGVVVNFNPLYTVPELTFQARDAHVKTMITLDLEAMLPKTVALINDGVLTKVVVERFTDMLPTGKALLFRLFKGKMLASRTHLANEAVVLSKTLKARGEDFAPPAIGVHDVAVLQYTGGTTGTPKGAMLTHANLTVNVQQADAWFTGAAISGEERFLCVIPFFHVFAMTCLMNYAIAKASQMIMLPRFEAAQTLKTIHKLKPTVFAGVPTLFNALAKFPAIKTFDLSSLKFCVSGGAPLPLEVKREFEALSGCKLVEGYGLSETSPITHINPPDGPYKEGSIGLPVPGTLVSLRELGAPEKEVPMGEKGEICIRGPQVMKGYWNKPGDTVAAFVDGWFRTGDVGIMDEKGFVYIVDRIKDLILCSGFNVYPRRIEEAIYQHPAVAEVTVVGMPDDYRGESPVAFVKLRDDATITEAELKTFLQDKISKIEMPSMIEFRAELPKTLIGKLSKKELKAEATAVTKRRAGQ